MNRRNFVPTLKAFSFAAIAALAFAGGISSCSNMGGDVEAPIVFFAQAPAANPASAVVEPAAAPVKMGSVSGTIAQNGSEPLVARSVVPTLSEVKSGIASYTVSAWGTKADGTVVPESSPITVNTTTTTFNIGLEYGTWTLRADAKNAGGGIMMTQTTSDSITLDDTKPIVNLNFALDYAQVAGQKGAMALDINCSASGICQIDYTLKDSDDNIVALGMEQDLSGITGIFTLDSSKETALGELAPGAYQLIVEFKAADGSILMRMDQSVQIYSNITTNKIDGTAPYINAGSVDISSDVIKKYQQSVIYVGGTGIGSEGKAADDSNNGTQFDPVEHIERALQIIGSSVLTSADIPDGFKIFVQADTSLAQNMTLSGSQKISIIGKSSSPQFKIDGGESYSITSEGTLTANYIHFYKIKGFEVSGGLTTLTNCKITNGTKPAASDGGGGLCVDVGGAKAVLKNCSISGCVSDRFGGGVYVAADSGSGTAQVELENCLIGQESASCATDSNYSNYAESGGGGINVGYNGKAVFKNTKILYNTAKINNGSGGGIRCQSGTIEITGGQINHNYAGFGGGGISAMGGSVTINGCVIGVEGADAPATGLSDCGNYSYTNFGGGIDLSSTATLSTTSGFKVLKNYAAKASSSDGSGGGIYTMSDLTLDKCDISYNGAAANGGGVYAYGASAILRLQGGTISSNSADEDGGGVYVSGGATMLMSGDAVIGDKNAPSHATEHAYSNSATNGGGIAVDNASAYIGYTAASSPQDAFAGGIYYNYASASGGGVYMSEEASNKLYLYKGNVDKNCAIYFGGAAHCGNAGELKISKTVIGSNITAYYGGGISIGDGNPSTAQVTIEDALIQENLALKVADSAQGGAIRAASFDSFALKGGVSIPAGVDGATGAGKNDVWLANGETITIGSTLSATPTPVATITPETYAPGTAVLSDAGTGTSAGALVKSELSKFAVMPDSDEDWTIGYNDSTKKGVLSTANLYVSNTTGVDDPSHGTQSAPYKTLAYACNQLIAPNCTIYLMTSTTETDNITIPEAAKGLAITTWGLVGQKTVAASSNKSVLGNGNFSATKITFDNYSVRISAHGSDTERTELNDVEIINGYYAMYGGGLNVGEGAVVSATNLKITSCQARSGGGGINVSNTGKFTADGITISGCNAGPSAAANGGGICNYGSVSLRQAKISGCSAVGVGDGIYNGNNGELTLNNETNIDSEIYLADNRNPINVNVYFELAIGAGKIPVGVEMDTSATNPYVEGDVVVTGSVTEAKCKMFEMPGSKYSIEYDAPCGKLVDKSIAGGVTVNLGGNISFEIATPTASGEKARFNVIDNSSGTPIYVTPTSAQIKILQYGTPVYSADVQEVTAAYLPEGEYELYCKAVVGGVTYDTTLPFGAGGKYTPLTLEAAQAGAVVTFTNKAADVVTYKKNGGAAQTISAGDSAEITLNAVGDKVQFFGDNAKYGAGSSTTSSNISCSADCYVYGNIMSLVDSDDFASANAVTGYAFANLFFENTKIKNKIGYDLLLPATTLASHCYESMFVGCSSLTIAPELPATTLASSCYEAMFLNCSGLTQAPTLPATSLTEFCYSRMFMECKGLTAAPELPATTLANSCYYNMFYGCKSLTTAPELPATTLADACYREMFRGCTSLATAPELPAMTMTDHCYTGLFYGCTSLTTAPALPATTLADYCYGIMFYECKNLTSVPEELPATTLAENCYYSMFCRCSKLEESPVLPAPTPAYCSYMYMFNGCSKLKKITCLATDISSECTFHWVEGVFSTGTFTQAPGVDWSVKTGTDGIPSGWTVKGSGSAVPAGFVSVPGGTYNGSDTLTPTSSVFISGRTLAIGNLWVCDHEVTQAEYQAVMGNNPSNFTGSDDLPVEKVSWYDAIAYCNKRSAKEGLGCVYTISGISDWKNFDCTTIPTTDNATWNAATCNLNANGYRLPTEAEWEYIARNKNQDSYTYSGSNTIDYVAWYKTNSSSKTHEVKTTTKGNGLGIYDMSGNVLEWCWDYYNTIDTSTSATGPSSASAGSRRVYRGGGWNDDTSYCSVAYRRYRGPYNRDNDVGFRVVRTAP